MSTEPLPPVMIIVDDIQYSITAEALFELQDYIAKAQELAEALSNLPPDHSALTSDWLLTRLAQHDPRIKAVPLPERMEKLDELTRLSEQFGAYTELE